MNINKKHIIEEVRKANCTIDLWKNNDGTTTAIPHYKEELQIFRAPTVCPYIMKDPIKILNTTLCGDTDGDTNVDTDLVRLDEDYDGYSKYEEMIFGLSAEQVGIISNRLTKRMKEK